MAEKFKANEASEWNSHGHMGRGKVRKKLTTRTLVKGHAVALSEPSEREEEDGGPRAGKARPERAGGAPQRNS